MSSATTPPAGCDRFGTSAASSANGPTFDENAHADPTDTSHGEGRDLLAERRDLTARQKERFGGMKFGSCFFGWLTATGTAVLLTGLLTAAGAAIGSRTDAAQAGTQAGARTLGLAAGIALLAVTLVAYFAGGYVAGRMARFNGLKQGLGVWLWAIIAAVVLAILTVAASARFDALSNLNAVPQLPISSQTATAGSLIVVVGIVVLALVGALLGGLAGMRYHRRVDATILDTETDAADAAVSTGR